MLSAIKASELLTLDARKRQSVELAKLKQRKDEERLARVAEMKAEKEAETAERVAEQARLRALAEKQLVAEAGAQSARRRELDDDEWAVFVQKHARRFAATRRASRMKLRRTLRRPDHIDKAIQAKRGRIKLAELRDRKQVIEAYIKNMRRATLGEAAAQGGEAGNVVKILWC